MAAIPLALPAFPPAGPRDAYVLFILWLPFIIRAVILAKPMREVINKLSPHPTSFRRSFNPLTWKSAAETSR